MRVNYSTTEVPAGYKCTECGATNCKLWREYGFFSKILLLCADCSAKSQNKDIGDIDADGKYTSDILGPGLRTNLIGFRMPAIPTEAGDAYWSCTSVPQPAMEWWRRLPTRATGTSNALGDQHWGTCRILPD